MGRWDERRGFRVPGVSAVSAIHPSPLPPPFSPAHPLSRYGLIGPTGAASPPCSRCWAPGRCPSPSTLTFITSTGRWTPPTTPPWRPSWPSTTSASAWRQRRRPSWRTRTGRTTRRPKPSWPTFTSGWTSWTRRPPPPGRARSCTAWASPRPCRPRRRATSQGAGACASPSRARCSWTRACLSWTSRPTTWTWRRACGWRTRSPSSRASSCWSRTPRTS